MTVTRLACTLLVAVCVVNAYGPIKGGKKHRTTTPFPTELNQLPGDNANSVLGEPGVALSTSPPPASGPFWWQGNNAFTGAGGGVEPQQPQQPALLPQQPPQLPQLPQQPPQLPQQPPQLPQQPPQLPQRPLQPQGNPFLSGLKQPCTAANHLCVPKQECRDGLIVGQKKPLHSTEGECDAATQICCKLVLSSQPGVVTGQYGQPGGVVGQPGISFGSQTSAPGGPVPIVPGQQNQQGPVYGGGCQSQQPGFTCTYPSQPSQPGLVSGPSGQPQQPGIISGPSGQPQQPGIISGPSGQPQQPGIISGPSGQPQQPGIISGPSGQPQQPGIISGPSGQPQQPGIITGPAGQPHTPGLTYGPDGQPQQPGVISGPEGQYHLPGVIFSPSGQPQQPGIISVPTGQPQAPNTVYSPSGKPQQPGVISGHEGQAQTPSIIFSSSGQPQQPVGVPGPTGQSQQPGIIHVTNVPSQQPGSIFQNNVPQQQPGHFGSPQLIGGGSDAKQYYKPSPGNNGVPIGGSIFDSSSVTQNPNQKPYTGPLNTTPYPGCAAALKCVKESFCTADGVMSNVQVILTKEQFENKVPLTECVDPDTGIEGKCCRDPNYKDPWPAGMMMPGGGHNAGPHTLPDECSPAGVCLHSYQCGKQNTLSPLKSCRVPLDGASGVCCSSGQTAFQTGQQILSTGATSNSQSISGIPQTQTPFPPSQSAGSLANNPFISQAIANPGQGSGSQNFPTQQPQSQYTPKTPGQNPPFYQPGIQDRPSVLLPDSKLEPQQPIFPSVQAPTQPGFGTQSNTDGQSVLPGFQQQTNNAFPDQSQQTVFPGAPTQTQILQQPTGVPQQQPSVTAATGQGSVVVIQPPRTYPSAPQSTGARQPTPGNECGIRRPVSRDGLSKTDSGFGEFPWQALIFDNNNQSAVCSGAIVAPKAVVTTAHCVEKLESSDMLVKAGVWRLSQSSQPRPVQVSSVAAKSVHPKYESNSLFNDMAILILNEPFVADQHVDFICLPDAASAGPQNSCVATGWGKSALQGISRDDVLHQVPVQFVSDADCQSSFRSTFLGSYFQLHRSFQCAVPMFPDTDLCKVGVGGPVACEPGDGRYVLSGLYSWDLGCGTATTPTALSRLDAAWLRAVLNTPLEVLLAEDERRQELLQQQLEVVDADDKPGFSQGYGK